MGLGLLNGGRTNATTLGGGEDEVVDVPLTSGLEPIGV